MTNIFIFYMINIFTNYTNIAWSCLLNVN